MVCSQVSGPQRGWMFERARAGGGVVANLSSHLLFLLAWTFGRPARVTATWRCLYGEVEDELSAAWETPQGAAVTFESSWCVPNVPLSRTTIAVEGAHGTLTVDNDALEVALTQAAAGFAAGRTRLGPGALPQPAGFELNGDAYWLEDAHFLRWVTGGPRPAIDVAAAVEVQAIMDALYRSAAQGGGAAEVAA
jgi:predicted dehydrogenase